ncbi:MAG: nuclease [Ignavibacteriales bacterium]|nr:nuclease [Ignavibacteriales bacterium]
MVRVMLLALAVAASGFAQQSLRVSRIVDGDTVRGYLDSGNEVRVRLTGIDAPEDDQPYGAESTAALTALVGGGDVEMLVTDVDRYGRIVALLFRDGVNLNRKMIASGSAWHYEKYYPSAEFARLERESRINRVGLWRSSDPVAPWDWRRR